MPGLEITHGSLDCPACRRTFTTYAGEHGSLGECDGCGGQFVEHALLQELFERREVHRGGKRAAPPRDNPLTRPVRYLACPSCRAIMNRNNFGGSSGIVVDVCTRHGVWFDSGELPRVLAFVEAGGLERARARKEEERARRAHERRLDAALWPPATPPTGPDPLDLAMLADGVVDLAKLVGEAIKAKL